MSETLTNLLHELGPAAQRGFEPYMAQCGLIEAHVALRVAVEREDALREAIDICHDEAHEFDALVELHETAREMRFKAERALARAGGPAVPA